MMIKTLEKNKFLSITFLILITIEIFYFSSLSFENQETQINTTNLTSIAYHFIVFFLFSFFLLTTIKGNKKIKSGHIIFTLIISIIYAISDEVHQIFVPNRFSSIEDILTDSLGILFSILIYIFIDYKTKHKV